MKPRLLLIMLAVVVGVNLAIDLVGVAACTYAGFRYRRADACPQLESRLQTGFQRTTELLLALLSGRAIGP